MNNHDIPFLQPVIRHWKLVVSILVAGTGLAALLTVVIPARYESRMKFLVNNERADLVITPEKNQTAPVPGEVTETQVNSEIELLKSHDLLERVALDHKLYLQYESNTSGEPSRKSVERATKKLNKTLRIAVVRKTNIIDVSYRNADPDVALAVLQDLSERYLTSHLAAHSAPGTDKFFAQQVEKYSSELATARTALTDFHLRKRLFSMPQQQSAVIEKLQDVEAELKDVGARLHEQQSRQDENGRQLAGTPERLTTQVKQISNQYAIQQLEPVLTQLENRRIELTLNLKPTERRVVDIERQVENTKNDLDRIRAERTDERTSDLNTLYQGLNAEYSKGQIELRGLETRRAELARIRWLYLQQLADMDQSFVQLQTLEQNETEAKENYLMYTHRLDEARLAEALDREKFSNVTMIERPVSSPIPVFPQMAIDLAIGILLSIVSSIGIVFYLETGAGGDPNVRSTSGGMMVPTPAYQAASGD